MSGLLNRFLRSFRRKRIEPEPEQQRNPLPTAPLLPNIEIAEPIIETKYANIELFTRKPKTSNRITNVSISRSSQTIPLAIYRNNNRTTHAYILDVLKIFNSHGDNKSKKDTYLNDIRIIAELFKSPSSFDEIRRTRPMFSMATSIDEIEKSIKIITKKY